MSVLSRCCAIALISWAVYRAQGLNAGCMGLLTIVYTRRSNAQHFQRSPTETHPGAARFLQTQFTLSPKGLTPPFPPASLPRSQSLGDPFRVTGGNVIRKVMGHGHGRARRLSLRQCRLGNTGPGRGIQKGNSATAIGRGGVGVCGGTAGALSMFGGFDGGSRNGPYSNGRSAPDMNFAGGDSNAGSSSGITSGNPGGTAPPKSVRPTPMATSSSGLSQSNSHCCRSGDKEGGARVDGDSVAVVVRSAVDGGVDSGGSCHTAKCGEGDSCVQPSPSRQARVVPLDERRRRTESLGSWGGFAAVDGGGIAGIQGCGQVDCSGGGGEGADWADVKGDIREDQDLIRELDDTCGER